MQVLMERAPALMVVCDQCGALLSYQFNDVYEGHFIYCPRCHYKQEVALQNDYRGEVQNGT